jgi:hypothetical protein
MIRFRLLALALAGLAAATPPAAASTAMPDRWAAEPPRVRSLLERAWAAETGKGSERNEPLAVALYCEAARYGSAEAHYRNGLLRAEGGRSVRDASLAKSFFAFAHELGHPAAGEALARHGLGNVPQQMPACLSDERSYEQTAVVSEDRYVQSLPARRQDVAALVVRLAPEYDVDPRLARAIAGVESNFDRLAQSPKNARGVMQLIPETAARFNVRNPLDAEDNIRGGLAYLRWLSRHFKGDVLRVVAAYNAGEGAVQRHGGVPPYFETRAYVWRVLTMAGMGHALPTGLRN